ncbi:hypothetical protein CDD81_4935 [Ophiocordyceps australis]|uniref:Chromatin modification-related protein EAF6 n=1 Tax=Ophiocordyceps australis TaxID=1399860 RepID=A0A2C5XIT4_9HYPO|nr:hypothetical protein CDD81_4935 [Ophiocordyceps australis]
MTDPKPPNTGGTTANSAEYKKAQARVRELVERRRQQERRLAQIEETIALKETQYLESTPAGNIITGFDNYMKGASGAAAQRRKTGSLEQNRVFTRSSISYKPNSGDSTPGSTPASHTPTPTTASFKDTGSVTGTSGSKGKGKRREAEESEGDGQASNRKRTTFGGASRR